MSFVPIGLEEYIALHVRRNPGERPGELRSRVLAALAAKRAGRTCACGNPLWVLGSAMAGLSCFTCITLEATPESDFEIADACADA